MAVLLQPGQIGSLKLRNRMVMEPMVSNFGEEDGSISPQLEAFILERARHGIGLIILEGAYPHPTGRGYWRQIGLSDDRFIPGLQRLVDSVHREGVPILAQVMHVGRYAFSQGLRGLQPVAPSALSPRLPRDLPRELSVTEIAEYVECYGQAARRALAAGFDGVEIQVGSGYLLSSFLSPYSNQRQDQYGGSLANRTRFLLEIVERVRREVGPDVPITCRFNGDELMPEGNPQEDLHTMARWLTERGVDAFNLLMGWHECQEPVVTMDVPNDRWLPAAAAMRAALSVPVISANGLHTPGLAAYALTSGSVDFVGWARPLLADPQLPAKVAQGSTDTARLCIACCQGCFGGVFRHRPISCTVNPEVGLEAQGKPAATDQPRRVWVAGGGPAGMQAAITAAARGHRVTLCEQNGELGGQLLMAARPPFRQPIERVTSFLSGELQRAGVEVRLGVKVTADLVQQEQPEELVIATGSLPRALNLEAPVPVIDAWTVLADQTLDGQRVAVVGGGLVGLETAEYLARLGKAVTVLEQTNTLAGDANPFDRASLLRRVREEGIIIWREVSQLRWEGDLRFTAQGSEHILAVDAIINASGAEPARSLADQLQARGVTCHPIGDCQRPANIQEALNAGYHLGSQI